ncbi:cupin [Streptomyces sp. B6B3]|uniref:cupin n=1 Tax=Streptomyces sp. B6B3 TaxID=3153570 RepID=UPI00325D713E
MTRLAVMDTLDWDVFVERYWDRQPVLVTSPGAAPFEETEIFHAAVAGTVPPASRYLPANAQFTVGREQQTEPGGLLPEAADGSLDGYAKRLAQRLDGRRYALVVHVLHAFHEPQWRRERAFFSGLWERVGLPLTGAITTLFHGSYEHSPVGVHKDRFATFMYGLSGHKRMRFWAERPWSEPVSSVLDYQGMLAGSFTADVAPGQLLYWPDSYFHVGESALSDRPATSVNVGVPRGGHRASYDVHDLLYDSSPESLVTGEGDPALLPPVAEGLLVPPGDAPAALPGDLPEALGGALRSFRDRGTADRVADRAAVLSLKRWTGGGFLPAPPPAPAVELAEGDTVRAAGPIRWARASDGVLCAANGHVARSPLPPDRLVALLDALTAGAAVTVGDLCAGEPGLRAEARRLLTTLESFRALIRTAPLR